MEVFSFMEIRLPIILFLFLFLKGTGIAFSQGDRCSTIQPFCAGNSLYVFSNSNAVNGDFPSAEPGPDYACLLTQPFPAWFYLKISDSGDLNFEISQTENSDGTGALLDVDFIAWGPFSEDDDYCSDASLSTANFVGCSYSESARENLNIRNALEGEIYVVLITNYDERPGFISLQQTNTSGGSTDCSIVGSSLGPDQKLCGESEVLLDASNRTATDYSWAVYNTETNSYEEIPNETGPTLLVRETGSYKVTVRSDILDDEASDEILIEFFDVPVASQPETVFGCDPGDGAVYDLTQVIPDLIGDNSGSYISNFYLTEEDFNNNTPIENPQNFTGNVQSILATIVSTESECESLPVQISLAIADAPDLNWNTETVLCINLNAEVVSPVSIGKDLGPGFLYEWNIPNDPDGDGIQNPVLTLNEYPSNGLVTLTVQNAETGCSAEYTTQIKVYSPPREVMVEISGSDFDDSGNVVTGTATGAFGDPATYEYSLNNGPFQESPTFRGVPGGTHRITAREINGCGSATSAPFSLIGFPRYFTPNNDGYNDTWNVINNGVISIRKVVIFDRYGKLLKELNPTSGGWDGTYNGQLLPADDYWFLVEFQDKNSNEVRQFKNNFTLKR